MSTTLPQSVQNTNQSHNVITQKGWINNVSLAHVTHKNTSTASNKVWNILIGVLLPFAFWLFPSPLISKTVDLPRQQVEGTSSVMLTPTPTPEDICTSQVFVDSDWDLSGYSKTSDGFYLPKATTKNKFWYPPIKYKKLISPEFQKISIDYQAMYQNEESTSSATILIAIYDSNNDDVLEINAPEPNRQLIGFKKLGIFSDKNIPITPVLLLPSTLGKQVSFTGTHNITIMSELDSEDNQLILYKIFGNFIDYHGIQQSLYREVSVQLPTVDPKVKEFQLEIGTAIGGKLKIKNVNICDL